MDCFLPQFDYKPVALSCAEGAEKNDYDIDKKLRRRREKFEIPHDRKWILWSPILGILWSPL